MKKCFRTVGAVLVWAVVLLSPLSAATAPQPASGLHRIDAGTPQGLQDLFAPGPEALPLVSAHRGGAGPGFPENCIATFEQTLRHGWAMLEIDPRYTKDRMLVLNHDPTLDRTTSGTGRVADYTLAELKELRLKDRRGQLTEHRITTLDEAMTWARGKAILLVSSDLKELMAVCNRILVMSAGRVAGEFHRGSWSQEAIMNAAFSGYVQTSGGTVAHE